jgi:methylglutaconyl-CoA hydratase
VSLEVATRADRVRVLTLARPEVRNALDGPLIAALIEAYDEAAREDGVRAVVLRAAGPVFSAGADLAWMRRMAEAPPEANLADARALARLMEAVDLCPKPTLAAVQGPALAGALGLLCASDIVIAAPEAEFAVSEVRLGLIPAVISPYLIRAVGARAARDLVLTARRIGAAEAHRLGIVHEVAEQSGLEAAMDKTLASVLSGGPAALVAAKTLIRDVDGWSGRALAEETARRIADIRSSAEGREGIAAFLERRKPGWAR